MNHRRRSRLLSCIRDGLIVPVNTSSSSLAFSHCWRLSSSSPLGRNSVCNRAWKIASRLLKTQRRNRTITGRNRQRTIQAFARNLTVAAHIDTNHIAARYRTPDMRQRGPQRHVGTAARHSSHPQPGFTTDSSEDVHVIFDLFGI